MKEQILKIAIEQMRSGGYENLNFANIAAQLDTSRANLHHHFKNKEGLGIAATQHYIFHEKAFKDAIFREHSGDIKAILFNLEQQLADVVAQTHAKSSCILSQLVHDGEVPASVRSLAIERYAEEQLQYRQHIVKSIESGKVQHDTDPDALAFKIMAGIFGIIQMGLILKNKQDFYQKVQGTLTCHVT